MASSSSPATSAIPPSSSSSSPPPPPSTLSPLPSASQSPNATSQPPVALNSPPPMPSTSPPTSIPNSPPPASALTPPSQADPPSVSPPPPSVPTTLPPPTSPASSPPQPTPTSPPPSPSSTLPPPAPPTSSPPPPLTPTLVPPPSSILPPPAPPTSSPPPPLTPTLVPPPSSILPPPAPPTSSPPPPLTPTLVPPTPPISSPSPPSPPLPTPPTSPVANPPAPSPPSPVSASPPPSQSQTSPQNPSTPPPKNQQPSLPPPPSPPNNSSSGTPILTIPPPLPSPNTPLGTSTTPINTNGNKSSDLNPNNHGGGGTNSGVVLPVAIVTSILVLSLIGSAMWYFGKKKRRTSGYGVGFVMPSPATASQMSESSYPWSPAAPLVNNSSGGHGFINSPPDAGGLGNSKSWFNYDDLHKVTNGFSENNLLGEGGFGCVYKGCLPDGREVAVKQLKVGGSQGEREFRAEVEIIGRVHHRHLVSLVGYCIADSQRLLVYDYVPNDTLHHHLHAEGRPVMDWAIRVKVAAGAARGIAYLHEDCHPRIIHRDIKSSNILLDNNYEAQVSDFGLAKLAMDAVTHVTTRVMGTFGYMAPEYASSGKLTERSDVYSFGVVLLELITGRKPVDMSQPLGDESLVEWARPLLTQALETGNFDSLADPRLEKNYNEGEMFRLIETAAACIRHSAAMRPRMGLVVRALDGLADVDLNNGLKPGQSELFSVQSAELRLFQRMAFESQDYSSDFTNLTDFSRTSRNSLRDS